MICILYEKISTRAVQNVRIQPTPFTDVSPSIQAQDSLQITATHTVISCDY